MRECLFCDVYWWWVCVEYMVVYVGYVVVNYVCVYVFEILFYCCGCGV